MSSNGRIWPKQERGNGANGRNPCQRAEFAENLTGMRGARHEVELEHRHLDGENMNEFWDPELKTLVRFVVQ